MKKILIVYGPQGGATEGVAKKITSRLNSYYTDLKYVGDVTKNDFENYTHFILGASTIGKDTWDSKYPTPAWDLFIPEMEKISFENKKVAIFGLGNQIAYPDHFVDSIGTIASVVTENKGKIVGCTSTEGYTFTHSDGVENEKFLGLAIDNDTQEEYTDERINNWVKQISTEFETIN